MSDPYYDGVTTPDPERRRLFQSVFRPSPLEEVADAVSVATEVCPGTSMLRGRGIGIGGASPSSLAARTRCSGLPPSS